MNRIVILFSIFLISSRFLKAQDTVIVSPAPTYNTVDYPIYNKSLASIAEYGRTDIIYSPQHTKIVYSYHYNNNVYNKTMDYQIRNDSTIQIISDQDTTVWNYHLTYDGKYHVQRIRNNYLISGQTGSLIPLLYEGQFLNIYLKTGDTIYTTNYNQFKYEANFIRINHDYYTSSVAEQIYSLDDVDTPPLLHTKVPLPDTLKRYRSEGYMSEPYTRVHSIEFIVTSEGKIKNVRQLDGNEAFSIYPDYMLELTEYLFALAPLHPAIKNGKPVAVRYVMPVNSSK